MKPRGFPLSLFLLSVIFLVLDVMLPIPQSLGHHDLYDECNNTRFVCGNISVGYPFSGDGIPESCGYPGLQLHCQYDNTPIIGIDAVKYEVLNIDSGRHKLRIARQDFSKNDLCEPEFPSSNLDYKLFELVNAPGYANITLLYGCSNFNKTFLGHFNCGVNGATYKDVWVVLGVVDSSPCSDNVTIPVVGSSLGGKLNYSVLVEGLNQGFMVKWKKDKACDKCEASSGLCGHSDSSNQTTCYCPDPNDYSKEMTGIIESCSSPAPAPAPAPESGGTRQHKGSKWKLFLIIGLTVLVTIAIVVVCTICFISSRFKGKLLSNRKSINLRQKMSNNSSVEEFITKFDSLVPKRYSYMDIKKMTNKFKDKLGQGGYGTVYKGKLLDGCLVAVKVLSESNENVEDFMNEVASISRTSHVNIVTLLGFCFDRSRRALVYEFMPLGSLDKFIYNQESHDQISRQLELRTLYEIALGIARGLEYLHQGCNTRILHFDIKPHNILLDENFHPKISDFGLSKLCERKESIVSMTGPRGTVGYIAPEVFCRNFGGVSYKSDVYSYGMMILEMIGGRKKIDVEVSESSETNFPSWIYNHINQAMTLCLHGVETEEEDEIARRLIVVSLWCIQTNPPDRPSMTQVLDMLQGSLESLLIPPCPFLSSPIQSSETATSTFAYDP